MKKHHIIRCTLLTGALIFTTLSSKEKLFEEERTFRIAELIPDSWAHCPAVEPALPDDFIAQERIDLVVAWGKQSDVETFLKQEGLHNTSEMITAALSTEVFQFGTTNVFSCEGTLEMELQRNGHTLLSSKKLTWGEYPLYVVEALFNDTIPIHIGYLGLNDPSGQTIRFIHYPPQQDKKKRDVWEAFLYKTKPLKEYDLFCLNGTYMQDGYTYYQWKDATMKFVAEKRKRDGRIAIMRRALTPKRRTSVARLFPNSEAVLRVATAVIVEIHEEWISGRKYLQV